MEESIEVFGGRSIMYLPSCHLDVTLLVWMLEAGN